MDKEQAKQEIKKLIDGFKANYQIHKKELEANTETKLVEPLFEILGWTKKDFVKQEKAHRGTKTGHADYAFYIGDRIVFFLEVKKIGVHLEKEADKQVISYALSKRIPFAVSTNFEQLKIFCVEQEKAITNKFRVFDEPEDYVNRFQDLWLLSKESFEQNIILNRAEKEDRLKRRASIDKTLLEDLMHIRKLIAYDIEKGYPNKYDINDKDDIIQRIIDRLIFIRRCEDIGINPENIMLEEIRRLPGNKAYTKLKQIFSKYNDVYNAGLFAIAKDSDCDKIDINGRIIKDLAYYLYESKNKDYIYNFDWIDADVLGQVYEQYLGKILAQTKSGRAKLKNGQLHRKEQGIYYTPTYVVNYIVKNTIDELLKNKKIKAQNFKVLDPACGSGSFLIKAFDYIYKNLAPNEEVKQHKIDSQGTYSIKTEILKNNIFGVDLDNKAVEITKLNLLLKAAEKGRKLPEELDKHIQQGNSLIDDESVAKLNAFNWIGEFQEGSFDVVIGNPPYVRPHKISKEDKEFFWKNLKTFKAKSDLYNCFMEKGIRIMKEQGLFSFIVPHTWISLESFYEIRKCILDNCRIIKLVQLPKKVFQEATVETTIFVLQKEKDNNKRDNNKIIVESLNENGNIIFIKEFKQSKIKSNHLYNFELYSQESATNLLKKTKNGGEKLGNLISFFYGLKTGDDDKFIFNSKKNNECKKLLRSKDIGRYSKYYKGQYVWYVPKLMTKNKKTARPGDQDRFEKEKIIVARMGKEVVATYDNENYYVKDGMLLLNKNNQNLKFITGVLNSKLLTYYYQNYFITIDVLKNALLELPICIKNKEAIIKISNLVDKMLSLNKQLNALGDKKTIQSKKIEDEINKTDEEIDNLVYKIYGITEKEKKIIEESLK